MRLAAILASAALAACSTVEPHAPTGVAALGWMAGSWVSERDGIQFEEWWSESKAGVMFGQQLATTGGSSVCEYLRLEERGVDVVYVTAPGWRNSADFKRVRSSATEVVFENPEHDYPVRILYHREADGSLFARVEGKDGSGEDFRMRRR